jgi:Intracellular proteinase inhibitor/S-layer homology domain
MLARYLRICCSIMAAAAAALSLAAAPAGAAGLFSDIQGNQFERAIDKLAITGVLAGFPDGTFKPNQPVTRLALVEALARGLDVKGSGTIPNYKDLAEIPEDVRPVIAALLNTGAASEQSAEVRKGEIVYKLSTDKAVYGIDDPVDLTFTVTNTGKEDAKFDFATTQQYDFTVKTGTTEVARWSLGQTFVQGALNLLLAPGRSFVYTTRWLQKDQDNQLVPPGTYVITAVSMANDNKVPVTLQFQKGLLTTYPDNTFRPNAQVSRAEFAALVVRAIGLQGEATQKASAPLSVPDAAAVPPQLRGYVAVALDHHFMVPLSDGAFHPAEATTRGQAAGTLSAMMELLNKFNYVKGTVVTVGASDITVSSGEKAVSSYALTQNVAVYRNDKQAAPADIKTNDQVLMLLTGPRGRAGYIEATGP